MEQSAPSGEAGAPEGARNKGARSSGSAASGSASHGSGPDGSRARGADLARDALANARASAAARRKAAGRTPITQRGGAGKLRRSRWSGSGPDYRDPQPLSATLRTWVATAGTAAELKRATLFAGWGKIVGAEVADHCSPVTLIDGELLVQAESTAWATQIRMLAPQLLKRINAEVGDRAVIRIKARGPSAPSWKFGTRHVPGRGPRDTYG